MAFDTERLVVDSLSSEQFYGVATGEISINNLSLSGASGCDSCDLDPDDG
jgi:hypothetical protein